MKSRKHLVVILIISLFFSSCMMVSPVVSDEEGHTAELYFHSIPESVDEGDDFIVYIYELGENSPVFEAEISVEWSDDTYLTGSEGKVKIPAPHVEQDTEYTLTAIKVTYLSAEATIIIKDSQPQLEIDNPESIEEGNSFIVTVTVLGLRIQNVVVTFNSVQDTTNFNGQVIFLAPEVEEDTIFEISADSNSYLSAISEIIVENIPETDEQLELSAPPTVNENEEFIVQITSENSPVENAIVAFDEGTYMTDESGQVTLTAPDVEQNTEYLVAAEKDGYSTVTGVITVKTIEIQNEDGWVYGIVADSYDDIVENAEVCILLSETGGVKTSICKLTDTNGYYTIPLQPGTYTVKTSKQGYYPPTISDVQIQSNASLELNIILQKETVSNDDLFEDENDELIIDIINDAIDKGAIGAKIKIYDKEQTNSEIQYYDESYAVEINPSDPDTYSFTVSAEEGKKGIYFLLFLGNEIRTDIKTMQVTYDGKCLSKLSIKDFPDPSDPTSQGYLFLSTKEGGFLLVYAPHFSEHTITVSLVSGIVETISNIVAIQFYIVWIAILTIAVVVHMKYGFRKR